MKTQNSFTSLLSLHASCTVAISVICVLAAVSSATAQSLKIKNPAKALERSVQAYTEGDSKISMDVVHRTTSYAIDRYKLKDLVKDADIKHAHKELYEFLKWKLGSPTAIAAQYAGAGYSHFQKAYSDEAAAALMGAELPGDGSPGMTLPKTVTEHLKALLTNGIDRASADLQQRGIPPEVSKLVLNQLAQAGGKSIDRIGFNMPKNWDIDNRLVETLIEARRKQTH